MKKIIASFTVVVYFAFACGVMVNYHYCMNSFDSVRFYKVASDWCAKCGMHAKKHGCCHDEVKIVKLQDDHRTSSASLSFSNIQLALVTPSEFFSSIIFDNAIALVKTDHPPPLLVSGQDSYIQNRVFRL